MQDLKKGFVGLLTRTCQEFRQEFVVNIEAIQEVVKMYWVPIDKKKMSMDNKENESQKSTRERGCVMARAIYRSEKRTSE